MGDDLLAWCVVANVAAGTSLKHFAPGAKLWVLHPQWGDSEMVVVVGRHRGRGHGPLIKLVMPRVHLTNFRARGVYHPAVHALMKDERYQWKSREHAEQFVVLWTRDEAVHAGVPRQWERGELHAYLGWLVREPGRYVVDDVLRLAAKDGVLKDEREAEALEAVCEPLRAVAAEITGDYLAHPRWPEVTAAATAARALLAGEYRDH